MDTIEIIVTQADITPTTSTKSLNQISQSSTKLRKDFRPNATKKHSANSSTNRSKHRERQPLLAKAYAIDEDHAQTSSSPKYDSDTESKRSLSPSAGSVKKVMLASPAIISQNRTNLPSNERSILSHLPHASSIFFLHPPYDACVRSIHFLSIRFCRCSIHSACQPIHCHIAERTNGIEERKRFGFCLILSFSLFIFLTDEKMVFQCNYFISNIFNHEQVIVG